jgi:hypothetical protein
MQTISRFIFEKENLAERRIPFEYTLTAMRTQRG